MNNLPAGYIDIGGAAIHTSELRQHTKDVHRFLANLADAIAITKTKPGSDEAWNIIGNRSDAEMEELAATMEELSKLLTSLAKAARNKNAAGGGA